MHLYRAIVPYRASACIVAARSMDGDRWRATYEGTVWSILEEWETGIDGAPLHTEEQYDL